MIKIFKNFITLEECHCLSETALKGVQEGWIGPGKTLGRSGIYEKYNKRFTSRASMKDKKYPEFVIELSHKIREFLKIQHYPLIWGHGSEGVVVSVTCPGGDVFSHRDPRSKEGLTTYRCNIISQAAERGAKLYVDGELIEVNVGDLHCYYVSEQTHYVTKVEGETPRILWMFGAHRPYKDFLKDQTLKCE
jgi:hypothetical protein